MLFPTRRMEPPLGNFEPDRMLPFELATLHTELRNDLSVADIAFHTRKDELASAFCVTPQGQGPFAGILYLHPAPGSRSTFLDEALQLAAQGAACLLVDGPWGKPETWVPQVTDLEGNRDLFTMLLKGLRRVVDLLIEELGMDPKRLALVGHSFSALLGGVLAGVEKRIKAYVLMAGTGRFADVAVANQPSLQGNALEKYSESVAGLDPIQYVPHAAPSSVFYQIALHDQAFPLGKAEAFAAAGSDPKWIKRYDADHGLNATALKDRRTWLQAQLELKSPPLSGAGISAI